MSIDRFCSVLTVSWKGKLTPKRALVVCLACILVFMVINFNVLFLYGEEIRVNGTVRTFCFSTGSEFTVWTAKWGTVSRRSWLTLAEFQDCWSWTVFCPVFTGSFIFVFLHPVRGAHLHQRSFHFWAQAASDEKNREPGHSKTPELDEPNRHLNYGAFHSYDIARRCPFQHVLFRADAAVRSYRGLHIWQSIFILSRLRPSHSVFHQQEVCATTAICSKNWQNGKCFGKPGLDTVSQQ